jgi:hypothetical protein
MSSASGRSRQRRFSLSRASLQLSPQLPGLTVPLSVFNHYNRVRANVQAAEPLEQTPEWTEVSVQGGVCCVLFAHCTSERFHITAEPSVLPAQLHPHPHRLPPLGTPLPLRARGDTPLFEKSNVLVMYVHPQQHAALTPTSM